MNPSPPEVPPSGHWSPRLKAQVLYAIDAGALTEPEALRRFGLSAEELASWRRGAQMGLEGLKVTTPAVKADEGDSCWRSGCPGRFQLFRPQPCSCSAVTRPPCWSCENTELRCSHCSAGPDPDGDE